MEPDPREVCYRRRQALQHDHDSITWCSWRVPPEAAATSLLLSGIQTDRTPLKHLCFG